MSTEQPAEAPRPTPEFRFRLTLQIKYTLVFGLVFLSVLLFIVTSMFESEKEDLEELSHQQFNALFQTLSTSATEALSVGETDKVALRSVVADLVSQKITGLESVSVVDRNRILFVHAIPGRIHPADSVLAEPAFVQLEAQSGLRRIESERVTLVKKITYEAAGKKIFLGYTRLTYSLAPIRELISAKQEKVFLTGLTGFALALLIIVTVTAIIIRRIKRLHLAAREVTEGRFPVVTVSGNDELGDLTEAFNQMTQSVKERILMGKYVSDSTIEAIKTGNPEEHQLGGSRNELCFFFSDIRGFTAFSEGNSPARVVEFLNQLLDMQVGFIRKNGGDVDKFVGDEIMAVFQGDGKEVRAVRAAVEIQEHFKTLARTDAEFNRLRLGIGLHSGEVVSGNIGSHDRMDYTSIGDVVNTSARLCSAAAGEEVLITEAVSSSLPEGEFKLSDPFTVPMKNKQVQLQIFRVIYD